MAHSCIVVVPLRAWIVRGFIEGGIQGNHVAEEEFYRHALDVIEWGRSAWKDVPNSDRGAIFDETFCRGVRAMRLDTLMEVCVTVIL
jgi:hypothetical protein